MRIFFILQIEMNCSQCQNQFDHGSRIPRLLIFCGHSLCENCCFQLHSNNRIQCPQCFSNTFVEQINFLPKNLALLKVNKPSKPSNNYQYCLKHEKKYEAFCQKQKVLICVDCILQENHRNHEMNSIKNAYQNEQQKLRESIENIQNILLKIQNRYEQNFNNEKQHEAQFEQNFSGITKYFEEIYETIKREEQLLTNKVKEIFSSNIAKFQQKNLVFLKQIEQYSNCLSNLEALQFHQFSEIQFLAQVEFKQSLLSSLSSQIQQPFKATHSLHSKANILEVVLKSLDKSEKPKNNYQHCANNSNFSQPQTKPIASGRNKKSTASFQQNVIKAYQNVQSQQGSQNTRPMMKKVSKKDPVPHVATYSTTPNYQVAKNISTPLMKSCINVEERKILSNKSKGVQKQKYDLSKNCDLSVVEQKQSLFNSFFSNMTTFLNQQKYIYVIGGFNEDSSNILKFNLNNFGWEQLTNLKSPRSKFGCIAIDKSIFILGGKKGKQRISDIEIWDNGEWRAKGNFSLKKKRSGFGVISNDKYLYIIGGNDGESILNTMQILDIQTGDWIKGQPMNQARDQLSVCLGKNNKIYAIGGFGGKNNEPLKTVQAYDFCTKKWVKAPSLNTQRRALASASLADGIYAIGGFDGSSHLHSVEKLEQDSSQWIRVADLKRGRCTHSAIQIFQTQQIIVMGGFDEEALDSVERYSLITNEWQQIAKMPSPRFMHSCILFME